MNKRTNQSGSVVAFVIVGVVLASVVAGGVYLVNQRNKENIANQPSAGTNQPQPSPSGSNSNPNSSESRGASPSPTTSNPGSSSQNQQTQTSSPATGVTPSGSLPTSGPADDGLRVLALGILIGVIVAYIRSQIRKQQPVSL